MRKQFNFTVLIHLVTKIFFFRLGSLLKSIWLLTIWATASRNQEIWWQKKDKHMFTSYLYHVTIISNTLRDFVINLFWNVFPIMFSNRFKYKSPSNDITRIWILSKKNLFKFNVLRKKNSSIWICDVTSLLTRKKHYHYTFSGIYIGITI